MVTDIVGFTRLTQENEQHALRLLSSHQATLRPLFQEHRGREVRVTGDGFLVEFSSTLDAVRCAVAIQQALRLAAGEKTPTLRIAVHVGEVIDDDVDLVGEAVDIAVAVESLAPPGGVCLTRQAYEQVWNKLPSPPTTLGSHRLEGIGISVDLYRLQDDGKATGTQKRQGLDPTRVAVLPFTNISPDPKDTYLTDGLTEEIIHTLAKINELRVIAHTSVAKYRDAGSSIADIGRELSVGTVLAGSVRVAGDRLRITVQMISTNTEESVWSEAYDRTLEDVFAIQSDIAHQVAGALRVHLIPREEQEIAKEPTRDLAAYTDYLKGRYHWNTWTPESLERAVGHFESAIRADRGLAVAYSGLADTYSLMAHLGYKPQEEAYRLAEAAARKAVDIDATLAEAHTSLAVIHIVFGSDAAAAESELTHAIELNPSSALARNWYAVLLAATGRVAEGEEQTRIARELDPDSPVFLAATGRLLEEDAAEGGV